MKKSLFISLLSTMSLLTANAGHFVTSGDGTHYTMEMLSLNNSSGVTKIADGNYLVNDSITISAGDSLSIKDDGKTIFLADQVLIKIEGYGEISPKEYVTLRHENDEAYPYNIEFSNPDQRVKIQNVHFFRIGVSDRGTQGMDLYKVTFDDHQGSNSKKAALLLGPSGASYTLKDCTFQNGQQTAIAGAANYSTPIVIEDCNFFENVKANRNTPQLNLTAADSIIIRRCNIQGDSTLVKVGGVGVSNFLSLGNKTLLIEDCHIEHNRYGITTIGTVHSIIRNNSIINNRHDTNPMTGGSGISLYDSRLESTSMISGNQIQGNLWGVTIIGCSDVNLGKNQVDPTDRTYNPGGNMFLNNGNNGVKYDVYNNSANTVYAQGNTWNVAVPDSASIEEVIYHKNDDPSLGEVIYMPYAGMTAITSTTDTRPTTNAIYNPLGIRQEPTDFQQLPKGIYIKDGKKVIKR